jgi:uncharacterized protein (DUF1330 family)
VPVDPTGQDLKRYLAEDPGGPVVMLNLLRYKADGGREGYQRYVEAFEQHAGRFGAELVYVGDCQSILVAPEHWDWDAVLMVRYPSRQAFSDMVRDPEYQQVTHLRTEALDEAVLQATSSW